MLSVLDDVLPKLSGARVFSICDLRQGYHHIELDEESSYLTDVAVVVCLRGTVTYLARYVPSYQK